MGFTQVEEVEKKLMVLGDMAERVVRDFFREGWVGEETLSKWWVGLEEVVEFMDWPQEEGEEVTPGVVVENI